MQQYSLEESDVIIIGAGCAGNVAAINCAEYGLKTILVSKGPYCKSGITAVGFNGFGGNFEQPGDSPKNHLKDIVVSGKYLCDQDVAEQLTVNAKSIFEFSENIGIKFNKDVKNNYKISPAAGCDIPRLVPFSGGGINLLKCLGKKLKDYMSTCVTIKDDVVMTKLVVEKGQISGAIGLDTKTGTISAIKCNAIILAGGGAGFLWPHTDCPPESVGDIFAVACRAGVKLVNMEQQLHYPTVGLYPEYIKGLCASYEWVMDAENPADGGLLYNSKSKVFYPIDRVGTRDEICHVIAKEISEGRGTPEGGVYLDARNSSEQRKEMIKKFLLSYNRFLQFGIDVLKERIQVAPAAHTTLGGVKINKEAETSIKGVFACGECTGNVHGANRLSGHSYLDAFTYGKIAADSAYHQVHDNGTAVRLEKDEIEKECAQLLSYLKLDSKNHYLPAALKNRISEIVGKYAGPIRNKNGLETGIAQIESLRENELQLIGAPDIKKYNLNWIDCIEAGNMLDCAEIILRCALIREESRGTHYRDDFPLMDNQKTVRHSVVTIKDGIISVHMEDVKMGLFKPHKAKEPAF